MRLRPAQLSAQLAKGLAPVYLIGGDEPLQLTEGIDELRAAARDQGFTERQVFTVEPGFDWSALELANASLSLFAERRLLELRLPTSRLPQAGVAFVEGFTSDPSPDVLLLIETGKLDKQALNSAWLRAVDRVGVVVHAKPLSLQETREWVGRRSRSLGLEPDSDTLDVMVDRAEGNLLAAAQEIEKLRLLNGAGPVDSETVLSAVADSARYSIFDLADAALAGDRLRCSRILDGLKAEGVEPVLVLWSLSREARAVTRVSERLAQGASESVAFQGIWSARRGPIARAAKRRPVAHWRMALRRCARLDRVIKGQAEGSVWDELLQLAFGLCGDPLFRAAPPERSRT